MLLLPITAANLLEAGGKAANLARAAQAGFQIPESWVISRAALSLFLQENQLTDRLCSLLDAYPQQDWPARMQAYETACADILSAPIPPALQEVITPAVSQLLAQAPDGLAVRSSGVCEDLERVSFAGIYESYLGISDLAAFWHSLLRCWCAAWSPRALAYAQKVAVTLPIDGMAVLVQPVIPASTSGVIFTADPVSGNPWRFVLNATYGLSDRLMEGAAPADRFALDWETGDILERHLVKKPSASFIQAGSRVVTALPSNQQRAPSLTDEQVKAVGALALAVDRVFDRRMDIEWAILGQQVILLQARPLTALPPFFPHELAPEDAGQTWKPYLNSYGNLNPGEKLLAPLSRDRWVSELWHHFLVPGDIFPRVLFKEQDFNGYRYTTQRSWGGNKLTKEQIERWLDENETRLRRDWLAQLENNFRTGRFVDEGIQTAKQAVDWVRITLELVEEERRAQAAVWYASQWMVMTCEYLLENFFTDIMPDHSIEGLPGGLLQGLSCYSVQRTADAQTLGRSIQEDFVVAAFTQQPLLEVIPFLQTQSPHSQFLKDFSTFCRHYGMEVPRPGGEKNIHTQDTEGLLLVIKTNLLNPAGQRRVQEILNAGTRQRQAVEEQVRTHLRAHRPDQLERFNKLLDWAQFWTPALDNRKWHCAISLRLGQILPQAGAALAAEGLIDDPGHFGMLTVEQWKAYAAHPDPVALRCQYEQNKREYEHNRRLDPLPFLGKPPAPPEPVESDHQPAVEGQSIIRQTQEVPQTVFQGEAIAPGQAHGILYKVSSLEDATYVNGLTHDHILICPPDQIDAQWRRDWYSLFMVVRGLVTVQGATLHHATQIARECGVPFVNLTEDVFDLLPDRAEIEINGSNGMLRIIREKDVPGADLAHILS